MHNSDGMDGQVSHNSLLTYMLICYEVQYFIIYLSVLHIFWSLIFMVKIFIFSIYKILFEMLLCAKNLFQLKFWLYIFLSCTFLQ